MDEFLDAGASAEPQDAAEPAPMQNDAATETPHQETPAAAEAAPPAVESGGLEAWFAHWYPDPAPQGHPAPPFSGAAHHARDAFEDLKRRLGR